MQLNLANPIVFFDLETTGVNISKDRIIEISLLKVAPNGKEESKTRRINPGIPIPPEATAIHGISDEDVKDCPTFKEIAKSLAAQIEGCDLAGFNSNRFDIPLLAEEFLRADVDIDLSKRKFVDVQTIFHRWSSVHCRLPTSSIAEKASKTPTVPRQTPLLRTRCSRHNWTVTQISKTTSASYRNSPASRTTWTLPDV